MISSVVVRLGLDGDVPVIYAKGLPFIYSSTAFSISEGEVYLPHVEIRRKTSCASDSDSSSDSGVSSADDGGVGWSLEWNASSLERRESRVASGRVVVVMINGVDGGLVVLMLMHRGGGDSRRILMTESQLDDAFGSAPNMKEQFIPHPESIVLPSRSRDLMQQADHS
jgi:hypothetical protein